MERKEVPTDWWQQIQRTRTVRRKIERQFQDGVVSTGLTVTDNRRISGRRAGAVRVYTETGNHPRLPGRLDGIDLIEEQYEKPEPDACSCVDESYQNDYDPVPGGVQVDAAHYGSCACRLVDDSNNKYMATAAHNFDSCNDYDLDEWLYQPKDTYSAIGTVHYIDESLDFAAVDNSGPKDISAEIIDTGGLKARGRVTDQGMIDAMENDTTIHKRGKQTGATEGTIKDASAKGGAYRDCNSSSTEGYATYYICHEGGDSGGVYFIEKLDQTTNEYYAAIAGVHTAGWDCDRGIGPKAETIYNQYGLNWS